MASRGGLPSSRSASKSEIDHHDGVLLHDADQQDDSNQSDYAEILMADKKR